MMIFRKFEKYAEASHLRYGNLQAQFTNIFIRTLAKSSLYDESAIADMKIALEKAASQFQAEESRYLRQAIIEVAENARTATLSELSSSTSAKLPKALIQALRASEDYCASEIAQQCAHDAAFLEKKLRKAWMAIDIDASAQNSSITTAHRSFMIAHSERLDRIFSKSIRSTVRHALLTSYNETVLTTLADHGAKTVTVSHVDRKANVDGVILSITLNTCMPTYFDVRDDFFHPNANAVLTYGVENVSS